jgi:hypothetical protein
MGQQEREVPPYPILRWASKIKRTAGGRRLYKVLSCYCFFAGYIHHEGWEERCHDEGVDCNTGGRIKWVRLFHLTFSICDTRGRPLR